VGDALDILPRGVADRVFHRDKRCERADSAVCVNVFEDLATGFGELGREFFGVVVDLEGFLADSVGETFCKLLCGFSKGGVCFLR
jgi:hypothetical protein